MRGKEHKEKVPILKEEVPILFFNTGEEDRKAYLALKESGIPCEFYGPTLEEPTPVLDVGYQKFVGVREIKKFISKSKTSK